MNDKLIRLTNIGFTLAGSWMTNGSGIAVKLDKMKTARNVLYAFFVDKELVYIGKTTIKLHDRMQRYKTPAKKSKMGGTTNIKNHLKIKDCLMLGKEVQVYVLPDNGLLHYGGFHINLAAGLEDSLVRELTPSWNGGKKESKQQSFEPTEYQSYAPPGD